MRLYAHQDLESLIQSPGNNGTVQKLEFRRAASAPLIVQFVLANSIIDPGAATLFFALKEAGKYDADAVLLNGAFTKTGTGTAAEWQADLNFVTTALDTLFAVDGDAANDEKEITLMGELAWVIDGVTRSSGRLEVTITNNVYRGTETPSEETAAPGTYLTPATAATLYPEMQLGITTKTQLRAFATNGRARPFLIAVNITGTAKLMQVRDGTEADNDDYIFRPDDYVTTDNEAIIEAYL